VFGHLSPPVLQDSRIDAPKPSQALLLERMVGSLMVSEWPRVGLWSARLAHSALPQAALTI
jgi:hypothetical protein